MACEELQARLAEAEATIRAKDETIRQQAEKIAELEAENKHMFDSLEGAKCQAALTFDKVSMALKATKPGRKTLKFIAESKKKIETAVDEFGELDSVTRTGIALATIRVAANMIEEAAPPATAWNSNEDDKANKGYEYNLRGRNENRGRALLDHMTRMGKKTITSKEANVILEQAEGKALDRTIILRAMDMAKSLSGGAKEKAHRICRIVIPDDLLKPKEADSWERETLTSMGGGSDRMSRSRKWATEWDPV